MSYILGIDLGTSTSEVAVFKDGEPVIIPNIEGKLIMPSIVGMDEYGEIIVGEKAKEQLLLRPSHTAIEVKRLMGEDTKVFLGDREFSPVEISSHIVKHLAYSAFKYLDENIESAVITVPAYFTDKQRKATIEAGKLAGLNVERIINEPTAASLDYGINNMDATKNLLIYDLGGGTLDVTVLELFEGVVEVKASAGNNKLGGKDFDQAIIDYVKDYAKKDLGLDITDARALIRIKDSAEKCKIALSKEESYRIDLPLIGEVNGGAVNLALDITRELFDELIKNMVDSTKEQIEVALEDANLKVDDIDNVLLVGGSTRIPYVAKFIESVFGKNPLTSVDPDLAVVRGASIQGAILNGQLSSQTDIMLTDVCPYTLGVECAKGEFLAMETGFFDPIINRNTTIPTKQQKKYCTSHPMQTSVDIRVYQGDSPRVDDNIFLGEFKLSGIPKNAFNVEPIDVSFMYDANGILQVEAIVCSTGTKANISIDSKNVELEEEVDYSNWKQAQLARKYRATINKADRLVAQNEYEYDDVDIAMLESGAIALKKALVKEASKEELDRLHEELNSTIYDVMQELE